MHVSACWRDTTNNPDAKVRNTSVRKDPPLLYSLIQHQFIQPHQVCLPRVRIGVRWMALPQREAAGGYRHVRPRGRRETRVRILVVEDEPTVARALHEGLAAEHYDVVVAHTGEEGFFYAHAEIFDVVVLDLMLPGR